MDEPHGRPSESSKRALEATRSLLRIHASGADSWEELCGSLARTARLNPVGLRASLVELNRVLVDPATADAIPRLVAWDANWVVGNPAEARAWLRRVAEVIGEELAAARRATDEP